MNEMKIEQYVEKKSYIKSFGKQKEVQLDIERFINVFGEYSSKNNTCKQTDNAE